MEHHRDDIRHGALDMSPLFVGWVRSALCARLAAWLVRQCVRASVRPRAVEGIVVPLQQGEPAMTTMSANLEGLAEAVTGRVSTRPADLEQHGHDENYPQSRPPLAVVFAESTADVQAAVRWAGTAGIAVVPFGTGTSFEGRVVPVGNAISIDMSAMDRVLEVRDADLLAVVQPGVTRTALNQKLRDFGLFFPVDPGADASLGGMAATNASGTTTVRYGGMRVNTVALEVVLATGDAVRFGRPVRKTSSGYDMKDLIVGSGGTLGVITELTVNLYPVPEHVSAARFVFPSVADAASAAYALVVTGLPSRVSS
jgi:D-lactate dehydrogenase (cytochrome)